MKVNQSPPSSKTEPSEMGYIGGLFYLLPTVGCAVIAGRLTKAALIFQVSAAVVLAICYGIAVGLSLVGFAKDHQARWISPVLGIAMTTLCGLAGRVCFEQPHLGVLGAGMIIPAVWRLRSLFR